MCPLCISAGAAFAAGAGSTGLAALIFGSFRLKKKEKDSDDDRS